MTLGSWVTPALRPLHALRRICGSKRPVFGYYQIRRIERALIAGYRDTVDSLLSDLTPPDEAQSCLGQKVLPSSRGGFGSFPCD